MPVAACRFAPVRRNGTDGSVRRVLAASIELIYRPTNPGQTFGPGSTFSLDGKEHLARAAE
jgi:hypothetical protein